MEQHPLKPLFKNAILQTVIASKINIISKIPSKTDYINLSDGDTIAVEISQHPSWDLQKPTIILVHGLCGSHDASYMRRITNKLLKMPLRVVRCNFRDAGSGKGLAKYITHAGSTDEVYETLVHLKQKTPDSKFIVIGFSMGGSLLLKLLGENRPNIDSYVELGFSICPPTDLSSCSEIIDLPSNKIFRAYFVNDLIKMVYERHERFPDLGPAPELHKKIQMREFDDMYTSIQCGFENADDYYTKSSSLQFINNIHTPCHIFAAKDDPVIDNTLLLKEKLPKNVKLYVSEHGGHMGFLASPFSITGVRWMDYMILKMINAEIYM
jgi:hypothetical protein